jgi:hypothetical protein
MSGVILHGEWVVALLQTEGHFQGAKTVTLRQSNGTKQLTLTFGDSPNECTIDLEVGYG